MTQKLLSVLGGNIINPPPIWMMRQAGRHLPEYLKVRASTHSFIDFCFSPKKAAEVTLQPIERYDMDAAILFADILLVPMAMNRQVRFEKGVGPRLDPISVSDINAVSGHINLDVLNPVYETVSRVRNKLPSDKSLIGFCGGPWTVATYMIEGRGTPAKEGAKRFAYENAAAMDDLLDFLVEISAHYMAEQARAGADVLMIFESWAEGLPPAQFERLVTLPTQKLIKAIRAKSIRQPIIGFPRGAGFNTVSYINETGITAIGAGTDAPLGQFRSITGDNMAIQGNLDPLALRIGGKVLQRAVDQVLKDMSGPSIFNLGHGISPDVKIDNVQAVIDHVRSGRGNYV